MRILHLLLLAMFIPPVLADVANTVRVEQAFARAAIQQQRNSAAFMTISNNGQTAHVSYAKSPVAQIVELHTHINDDGVMRMRKIEKIELPAGEKVRLKPGGLHVMLLGLKKDLKVGDTLSLTLGFDDASEKVLQLPVKRVMMHYKKAGKMGGASASGPAMMTH